MTTRLELFLLNLLRLFKIYLFWLIIFFIARVIFTIHFGKDIPLNQNILEIFKAFIMGFRTDTVIISYILLLPFLLNLALFSINPGFLTRYQHFYKKFLLYFGVFSSVVIAFAVIADHYFFVFFSDHLNILVFDFFKDDTKAVLTSMWTDYPFLRIVLSLVVVFILARIILNRIVKKEYRLIKAKGKIPLIHAIFIVLSSIAIFFSALRNSWGTFPLTIHNTIVSDNLFINKIGINSIFSFQNAVSEILNQNIDTDLNQTLKRGGFSNVKELLEAYPGSPDNNFFTRTKENEMLEAEKPHVVFVQMESMSEYLMPYHSEKLNLLGQLQSELSNCYYFHNFIAGDNTTIKSMEQLLFNTPLHPISQSSYRERYIPGSVPSIFTRHGYQSSFFTGGKLAWRNLDKYMLKQEFEIAEGNIAIRKKILSATEGEWGVYDEFLFDRAYQQLLNGPQSKFIFIMTTTNHTPYDIPENYKALPIEIDNTFKKRLKTTPEIALKGMLSYQYANDCLGRFIKKVRESPAGEKTIIAVSGDHTRANFFNFSNDAYHTMYEVPFIIYVPERFKPQYEIDTGRFGSHKDIFPTLFNLALSDAAYLSSGNNLLAEKNDSIYYFGANAGNFGISKDGAVEGKENFYFRWETPEYKKLVKTAPDEKLEKLKKRVMHQEVFQEYYIKTILENN